MRELNLRIPGGGKGGRKRGEISIFCSARKKRDELVESARRWERDGAGFDHGKKNSRRGDEFNGSSLRFA